MSTFFTKVITWIKANLFLSIGILLAVILLFFPHLLRKITGPRRVHHRRVYRPVTHARRHRTLGPVHHRTRRQYTRGGRAKKPWQIKGSRAARLHMAKIRRMR
jgi:hypothetical protein